MNKFETFDDALKDAKEIDENARVLDPGESFSNMTPEEQSSIIDIHSTSDGAVTWCWLRDISD